MDQGTKLYRVGRYQEAAKEFQKAAQLNPGLLKAWKNLGRSYYKSGKTREALGIWQTVLKVEPENLEILNSVGFLFLAQNQWRNAIPYLEKSLKYNADQSLVRVRLGKAYKQSSQYRLAIGLFEKALKLEPGNETVLIQLADAYEKSGQRDRAMSVYKNYLNLRSGEETLGKNIIAGRLSVLLAGQGDQLYKIRQFQKAETFYKEALVWVPNNSKTLLNLGWALEKQGKYDEAITAWLKLVDRGSTGFELFHQIANAYYHSGQIENARIWYENAEGMDPSNNLIQSRLFELAIKQKEIPDAMTALDKIFTGRDADRAWSQKAADYFIRYSSFDQGAEFFRNRLARSSHPEATKKALAKLYIKKGTFLSKEGNTPQAISNYEKALSYETENAAIYRSLGWLYWREKQWGSCEKLWKRYGQFFPLETEPYNLLARLYLFRGAYEKSLSAVKKSLEVKPEQPDQKLLQVKALLGGKRYLEAMEKAKTLAKEFPEHLPIQFIFGEALMLKQNFMEGVAQWRKVLDMGSNSQRAGYYWIKSLYETGEFDSALREAKKFLVAHEPYEPILRLLRDDSIFREDFQEAIFWQNKILEQFGDHPAKWLKIAKLYEDANEPDQVQSTLDEAQKKFPENVEVQLSLGELALKHKNFDRAMRIFQTISRNHPGNRWSFSGNHSLLVMLKKYPEALKHLELNKSVFFKDYEIEMATGNILNAMGNFVGGNLQYFKIINSGKQDLYFPILLYHGLSGHPRSHNLWIDHFIEQLKVLKNAGYQTITVAELKSIRAGKMAMPLKPILLTFDDARIDAFQLGDPVLKRFGMKATIFVPTDRANHEHPFFANWDMIKKFSSTGRWDIQGHGDQAHDLIPINATGERGYFLSNFMWRSEEQMEENESEYYSRLKRDYSQSSDTIKQEIPDARVTGYAYPFSEAGQTSHGNASYAQQFNETLLSQYFQFGFIQDGSGYNRIRVGDENTSLLRRFSVPPNWDGERLVQHLAENHPSHVAQLALAKTQYWRGYYAEAGSIFSKLVVQEPRLKNQVKIYLADISFQGGNYWESEKILQEIPPEDGKVHSKIEFLKEAVAWKKRPRVFGGFDFFHDSNDRTNYSESARIHFPLDFPMEFMLEGSIVNFEEKGRNSLDGNEVTAGINWGGLKTWRLEGKFRNRYISQKSSVQSYWASAQYVWKQNKVQFSWSEREIDTVQAIENGIQVKSYGLGFQTRIFPKILGHAGLSYRDYDDGNNAFDMTTRLRHNLPDWKNWKTGADLSYKDSDFESPAYYTPDQLLMGIWRVFYHRKFSSKFDLRADYGFGGASDKVNGERWVSKGGVNLDYSFTKQLKAGVAAKFSVVPGYNSMNLEAFLGYRF